MDKNPFDFDIKTNTILNNETNNKFSNIDTFLTFGKVFVIDVLLYNLVVNCKPLIVFLSLSICVLESSAQIQQYVNDSLTWATDIGAATLLLEDFESFTADETSFQGTPLPAKGFTLVDVNPNDSTYSENFIDGPPTFEPNSPGSTSAFMFVERTTSREIMVCMDFNPPVRAFHAAFRSVATTETIDIKVFAGATEVQDTQFTMANNNPCYGFIADLNQEDITKILFSAVIPNPSTGEGFFMDDVQLVQSNLIPTLSEWAIILLSLLMLIVGSLAYQQRRALRYS